MKVLATCYLLAWNDLEMLERKRRAKGFTAELGGIATLPYQQSDLQNTGFTSGAFLFASYNQQPKR